MRVGWRIGSADDVAILVTLNSFSGSGLCPRDGSSLDAEILPPTWHVPGTCQARSWHRSPGTSICLPPLSRRRRLLQPQDGTEELEKIRAKCLGLRSDSTLIIISFDVVIDTDSH